MKFFEYSYGWKSIKNFDSSFQSLGFFTLPFWLLAIISIIWQRIRDFLEIEWQFPGFIVPVAIILCFFIGIYCAINNNPASKGVFLGDDYLEVEGQIISPYNDIRKNPKIEYKNIDSCELIDKYDYKFNDYHYHFFGGNPGPSKEYVKIITHYEKIYCFSVENQEEFIKLVNEKMKQFNNL